MQSLGVSTSVQAGNLGLAGVETILITTPLVSVPKDTSSVFISGAFATVTGAATTRVSVFLRRGATLTSTLLFAGWDTDIGANVAGVFPISWFETVVNFAQVQYSLTATTVGATGGSTLVRGCLALFFMS